MHTTKKVQFEKRISLKYFLSRIIDRPHHNRTAVENFRGENKNQIFMSNIVDAIGGCFDIRTGSTGLFINKFGPYTISYFRLFNKCLTTGETLLVL